MACTQSQSEVSGTIRGDQPRSSEAIRGNQPSAHLCEPWFPHTPQVVHTPWRSNVVVRSKGLDTCGEV